MNVQLLLRQSLQPCDEGLFTLAFNSNKESRACFDDLRWHGSADMRHGPKFPGEVFFHQARLAAQPLDFARAINACRFAAQLFGKKHLLLFQFIENRGIMSRLGCAVCRNTSGTVQEPAVGERQRQVHQSRPRRRHPARIEGTEISR